MCHGSVMCVRAAYCMLWWCTVYYGGVLYVMVRVVYCVVVWCTVCYGGVLYVMAVYGMLG